MTYDEAMRFWYGRINYEVNSPRPRDLSLERIRHALDLLGNPHQRFRIVHVAGSKGKGSTSAMLASILERAGYRVGLFTSPHLNAVEERMQVDGVPISAAEITRLLEDIRHLGRPNGPAPGFDQTLTFFEIATAIGFTHFAQRRVEIAVVEVGLGGRFDSTNVCRPMLSIITSISFDHTQYLGNTLAQIAMEKAGIVKPGRPCVSGVRHPDARGVIERICCERAAPLRESDRDFSFRHEPAQIGPASDLPARVWVKSRRQWPAMDVGLIGEHQAANAALAVVAVEVMREQGLAIGERAVADGLAKVRWPARLEVLGRKPLVVLDCAHNVASAEALIRALEASLPATPEPARARQRRFLIFAGSSDKDLPGMLRVLAPFFARIALTRFAHSPRAVPPEQLATMLPLGTQAEVFASAREAWEATRRAATADDLICVTGSVFLAGELREIIRGAHT